MPARSIRIRRRSLNRSRNNFRKMAKKKNIIGATGRRKTAVARIRLFPGAGTVTVNERTLENYFPRDTARMRILEPFEVTETKGNYDVLAKVHGGGASAQAD